MPLALVVWDWWRGQLGANPLDFVTRTTGTLTLVFLAADARRHARCARWTGAQWLVRLRRMLGLYAFFYGSLHFLCLRLVRQGVRLGAGRADVAAAGSSSSGCSASSSMAPLAVTSTNAMIKRLGGKRWARLHRLVYVSAVAGVFHFYLLVKADTTKPLLFAAVLAALLGYRWLASQRQKTPLKLGVSDR